ncbi:MAG: UbiA family prenyltransferase [Candidatus Dormibacteria bacterium]
MRWLLNLARCSHPAPTAGVTAIAGLLALRLGRGGWGALGVAAAILCGQLSVGWANDLVDRGRDAAAGRHTKPLVTGLVNSSQVRVGIAIVLPLAIALSLFSGVRATIVHAAELALAHAYNLGLKATPLSWLPYAAAFGLLPVFVTLGLTPSRYPPLWSVGAAAALGAGAHFVNAIKDLESDRAQAVLGLPQRLGARASLSLAASLLAAGLLLVVLGPAGRPGGMELAVAVVGAVLVTGALVAGARQRGVLAFQLTIGAAGAAVVALVLGGRGF